MRKYTLLFPFVSRHAHENLISCSLACWTKAPPGDQLFRSNLPDYEIFYVTAGKGDLIIENTTYPFQQGDLVLLHLQSNHGYIADTSDPYEFYSVNVQHRDFNSLLGTWFQRYHHIITQAERASIEPIFEQIIQRIEQQQADWEAHTSALIYELLMYFYRATFTETEQASPQPAWVGEIRNWIEQNLESQIHVKTLAKKAHMSVYHFSREFKKYFVLPPLEYVNQRRVIRARYLLMRSDQSIEQISRLSGFPNHHSLIHNFKRAEGCTPSVFRKSIQGNHETVRHKI